MLNPIAWVKLQYRHWKDCRHLEGLTEKVHDILNNCIEVLNEKYFFVKNIDVINKPNGYVIVVCFDPRTSKLPKLFNGGVLDNQNSQAELCLYVVAEGTVEDLLERAIDVYVWACCLPGKGSQEYMDLIQKHRKG